MTKTTGRLAIVSRYTSSEKDALVAACRLKKLDPKVFQKQAAMIFAGQVLRLEMEDRRAILNPTVEAGETPPVQGDTLAQPEGG